MKNEDTNLIEGAANALVGIGTKSEKNFRQSDSNGSISTVYVPDSPQTGVIFGMKVSSNGGRIGFRQDEGPSVKKDTDYTQSVWVKGTKGATGIIQSFWDQEGVLGPATKGFTMTGEWQKVSYTYHATENHSKVSWGYCYINGGEASWPTRSRRAPRPPRGRRTPCRRLRTQRRRSCSPPSAL